MLVKRSAVGNTVLQVLAVSVVVRGLNRIHQWTAVASVPILIQVLRMQISIQKVLWEGSTKFQGDDEELFPSSAINRKTKYDGVASCCVLLQRLHSLSTTGCIE